MAVFEDVIGESEDYGAIPARTKSYTAADVDFLLKKKIGCVSELPTANENNLGIVLLLTDNQPEYDRMHFYKCVRNGDNYKWKDLHARLPCGNCTNITAVRMDGGATCAIKWSDPVDESAPVGDWTTVDKWDHTVLVKNYDHEPTGINDGIVVITCGVRDQYSTTPFLDIAVDTTKEHVYYKLIPVGANGTETIDSANAVEATTPTWDELHELIQAGLAPAFLPKGSQISVQHSVYGTLVFKVMGYEDLGAESDDGTAKIYIHDPTIQHCVVLMSAYILPGLKQFDASETQYGLTLDTECQLGKTYYIRDGDAGYTEVTVNVGDPVPADTYYELNPNTMYAGGTNRWDRSGLMQWLNSDGSAGTWWVKKHANDVKPDYADTEDGFLNGFTDPDFTDRIIELTNFTEIDTTTPRTSGTLTVDKVWLPSYGQVKNFGTWGYNVNTDRVMYLAGEASAEAWWTRSPHTPGSMDYIHLVNSSGGFTFGRARLPHGVVPCLAIA